MNTDPNKVTSADPQLLLTNVIWGLSRNINQDPLYATRVLVNSDGESAYSYYKWTRGSFSYYHNLRDIIKLSEEAKKISGQEYEALALFFKSIYFYELTMTFGDIPYSEALKGESENIYTPKYDSQEKVFEGILSDLKEANELLKKNQSSIKGDIIYGGNSNKWRKAINSFRLKVLMTLSKKENSMPQIKDEFAYIVNNEPIISANSDNMQMIYLDRQDNRYPMFNDSGFGSAKYMDEYFISVMVDRKDPRLLTFATQTKNALDAKLPIDDYASYGGGSSIESYANVNQRAVAGIISKPHTRYYQNPVNEPHILLGVTEISLVIAEGIVRGWVKGSAESFYNSAILSSFEFYNTYVSGYDKFLSYEEAIRYVQSPKVRFVDSYTYEKKLELIMIQHYISTYFQGTWATFYNYLRTGFPKFPMIDGVTVPTRWLYPQSEYNNNKANVEEAIKRQFGQEETIRSNVWWLK